MVGAWIVLCFMVFCKERSIYVGTHQHAVEAVGQEERGDNGQGLQVDLVGVEEVVDGCFVVML